MSDDAFFQPEDFAQFEAELGNNHNEDSCFVARMESNAQPMDDGNPDIMSIRFTYVENMDDLEAKKLKQIKFWIYKDEAAEFAEGVYRQATARKLKN